MAPKDPEKIERFLRRNLRMVARDGGLTVANHVALMHGSFLGLKRTRDLPEVSVICGWGAEEGLSADDVLRLDGIAAVVHHSERNFGRLTTEAAGDDLVVRLTRDEAVTARGAALLVLDDHFCNVRSHRPDLPEDWDRFWDFHTLTGRLERDYRYLLEALSDRIPPRDPNAW